MWASTFYLRPSFRLKNPSEPFGKRKQDCTCFHCSSLQVFHCYSSCFYKRLYVWVRLICIGIGGADFRLPGVEYRDIFCSSSACNQNIGVLWKYFTFHRWISGYDIFRFRQQDSRCGLEIAHIFLTVTTKKE